MKKFMIVGLILALSPWANEKCLANGQTEPANKKMIVCNGPSKAANVQEDDYSLNIYVEMPSRLPSRKELKAYGYSTSFSPSPYVVAYGPVLSHTEVYDYSQITTNPYWLYGEWPYHQVTTYGNNIFSTYTLGSWNNGETSFNTNYYSPFNVQDNLLSVETIDITPGNGEPLFAYVLWVVYDDYYNTERQQHEPRPLAIKMSKVQITDDCGSLYNQGGGADIMTGYADDFYASFTSLSYAWTW